MFSANNYCSNAARFFANTPLPPALPCLPPPHIPQRLQIRETCATLSAVGDRLASLRRRAELLEAELEADGCVAGNSLGELRL